jgi:hypothetical protein
MCRRAWRGRGIGVDFSDLGGQGVERGDRVFAGLALIPIGNIYGILY